MDKSSREYLQQAIDAEIKSLEESIRLLKSRRNALTPISSLPTEVISTIFSLLRVPVASSPLTPPTPSENPDTLPWLRLSHVCHHWREITLNQPLFWSHLQIANFSLAGAVEMLSRAKMLPLHLEARIPDHWNDARFNAFQKELCIHTSHISHLDISVTIFIIQTGKRRRQNPSGPSLTLFSMAPHLDSLASSFAKPTSVGSHLS